jgi:hypothetical protein
VVETLAFTVGLAIEGTVLFGDADASMAIIVTNMEVVSASVSNFGTRCVVFVVSIFLSEPLSMTNKFPDPHHAYLYRDSTIAQLCFYRRLSGTTDG